MAGDSHLVEMIGSSLCAFLCKKKQLKRAQNDFDQSIFKVTVGY